MGKEIVIGDIVARTRLPYPGVTTGTRAEVEKVTTSTVRVKLLDGPQSGRVDTWAREYAEIYAVPSTHKQPHDIMREVVDSRRELLAAKCALQKAHDRFEEARRRLIEYTAIPG